MTTLSSLLFWLFALLWGATSLAALALPRIDLPDLDQMGWAVDLALGWGNTQTGAAMALMAVAWICAVAGRPGFAALGIGLSVLCLALAAATLDPRVTGLVPEGLVDPYNALRGNLPFLRLGSFLGLALIGAACLFAREDSTPDRWLVRITTAATLVLLATAAATGEIAALSLLTLPALIVLLMLALQMAEAEQPGGAYAIAAIVATLTGLGLLAADAGQRIDLRPAFVALPLLMLAAHRRRPRIAAQVHWLHAVLILGAMAYLAPGMAPVFDQFRSDAMPTNFAEIRAALARGTQLRTGAGVAIAVLTLAGLVAIRWRRTDRPGRVAEDDSGS